MYSKTGVSMNELHNLFGNMFSSIHEEISQKYPKLKLDLVLSYNDTKFVALASFTNISVSPSDLLKFEKKFADYFLSVLQKYDILLDSYNLESILNVDKDKINFRHNSMLEILFDNIHIKDFMVEAKLSNKIINDRYYIFI